MSDHSPMLIRGSVVDEKYGPMPFHFQNMWIQHPTFQECVAAVWREPTTERGLIKLAATLKS